LPITVCHYVVFFQLCSYIVVCLYFRHEYSQLQRDTDRNMDTADKPKLKLAVLWYVQHWKHLLGYCYYITIHIVVLDVL